MGASGNHHSNLLINGAVQGTVGPSEMAWWVRSALSNRPESVITDGRCREKNFPCMCEIKDSVVTH